MTSPAYRRSIRGCQEAPKGLLAAELLAVVDQTMEPTRVSLWLRPPTRSFSGTAGSEGRPPPWAYSSTPRPLPPGCSRVKHLSDRPPGPQRHAWFAP